MNIPPSDKKDRCRLHHTLSLTYAKTSKPEIVKWRIHWSVKNYIFVKFFGEFYAFFSRVDSKEITGKDRKEIWKKINVYLGVISKIKRDASFPNKF